MYVPPVQQIEQVVLEDECCSVRQSLMLDEVCHLV